MRVAAARDDLVRLLDELRALLRGQEEDFWADWIDGDAESIRRGDLEGGVSHFLTAFGGMGSLNDVYFHPMNRNAKTEAEGWQLTVRFRDLKERAYHLAIGLRQETGS